MNVADGEGSPNKKLNRGDQSPSKKFENKYANNFNWNYNKNDNRLTKEVKLPELKDCHQDTVNYV